MRLGQVGAVHLVGEKNAAARRLGQRQAAGEVDGARRPGLVAGLAFVGSFEDDFNRVPFQPRLFQDRRQLYAGPLGRAHRTQLPGHALGFRDQESTAVPCALECGLHRRGRQRQDLVVAEFQVLLDLAQHLQPPGTLINLGSGKVIANVETLVRCDEAVE